MNDKKAIGSVSKPSNIDRHRTIFGANSIGYVRVSISSGQVVDGANDKDWAKPAAARVKARELRRYDELVSKRNAAIYNSEIKELESLSTFIKEKYK